MLESRGRFSRLSKLLLCVLFFPSESRAGSITGASVYTEDCDMRVDFSSLDFASWCTPARKAMIRDQCFVAVGKSLLVGRQCSWQGCRYLSLVGRAPILEGSNVVEYGITTPLDGAPYEQHPFANNRVLPKRPFDRHYMTAGDAILVRSQCAAGYAALSPADKSRLPEEVFVKICGPDDAKILDLNPYWRCVSE